MTTAYHAEHVGSLLRPPWLLQARAANQRGELSDAELHEAHDRAAAEAIGVQRSSTPGSPGSSWTRWATTG